jgi:hypothetical protein
MTEDAAPHADEKIGVIVGVRGPNVVVRLESGEEVLCRSAKRLHRPLGFYTVPYGHRARIRYSTKPRRIPMITAVLDD